MRPSRARYVHTAHAKSFFSLFTKTRFDRAGFVLRKYKDVAK